MIIGRYYLENGVEDLNKKYDLELGEDFQEAIELAKSISGGECLVNNERGNFAIVTVESSQKIKNGRLLIWSE